MLRGLRGRCPRCGGNGVFASLNDLREHCPTCGLPFVREDGYWLGAMTVAITLVEIVFGIFFVGGMLLTWPDVPWGALTFITIGVMIAVPVLFYPRSKTVWIWLDLRIHPYAAGERPVR